MWMSGKKEVSYDVRAAFNQLADSGYVANVHIVNRDHVDFTITEKGKEYLASASNTNLKKMYQVTSRPNNSIVSDRKQTFSFSISDAGVFEQQLINKNKDLQVKHKSPINYQSVTETDYFGSIVGFLLPIIVLNSSNFVLDKSLLDLQYK